MERNSFLYVVGIFMIIYGIIAIICASLFVFAAQLMMILLSAVVAGDLVGATEYIWITLFVVSLVSAIAFMVTGIISIRQQSPKRCLISAIVAGVVGLASAVCGFVMGFYLLAVCSLILSVLNLVAAILAYRQNTVHADSFV